MDRIDRIDRIDAGEAIMSKTADDCTVCSGIQARITVLEGSDSDQWDAIKALQNRLPTWATMAISLLTFLCGILLTLAVKQ